MKVFRVKSLVFLTVIGDILLFVFSFWLVTALLISRELINSMDIEYVFAFIPVSGVATFIMMVAYDMYKNIFYRTKTDIIASVALIILISSFLSFAVSYLLIDFTFPRIILVFTAMTQIVALSLWRMAIWMIRKRMDVRQQILIIDHLEHAEEEAKKILRHQGHIFSIKYVYDIDKGLERLFELIPTVDHVMIGGDIEHHDAKNIDIFCMKHKRNVFYIPDVFSINLNKASFIQIDDLPLFNLSRFGLSTEQYFVKRIIDVLGATFILLLTLPITMVTALIMKVTDPGPVFFTQERVTLNDKKFKLIKFRTMVVDAESKTGPVLAMDKDPRITRLGEFMRSTRIDELPQLLNVLRGDMSLIGPRPEREFFIEKYLEKSPEFGYRTTVKAGVTGLAQVLGKYTTSFEDKLRYDLMYIKNYSLLLDLKIILKTVKVVLSKDAAVGRKESDDFVTFIEEGGQKVLHRDYGYKIVDRSEQNETAAETEEKAGEKAGVKEAAG